MNQTLIEVKKLLSDNNVFTNWKACYENGTIIGDKIIVTGEVSTRCLKILLKNYNVYFANGALILYEQGEHR